LLTDVGDRRRSGIPAAEMAEALAQRDVLVGRRSSGGGHVFSTAGDGFAAAFGPRAAALTTIAIQEGLAAAGSPLGVRMGLNTGRDRRTGGDYFGPTLNRRAPATSRLAAWVLCSSSQPGCSTRASGRGLIDLGEPAFVTSAGPARGRSARRRASRRCARGANLPGNLPTKMTEFVGRTRAA
jgi:hypothetical protein